jgi:hypothetical protein
LTFGRGVLSMRYVALAPFILSMAVTVNADDRKVTVYGWGNHSCGKWLASINDESERFLYSSWVLGWVSAAGYYDVQGSLRKTDSDAMRAWIDNYCHDHPLETIDTAASALVRALAKHKG